MNNLEKASLSCQQIVDAVRKVFVGDELIIRKLLAAAMANGHVLFEDYPGLGKTLLAKVFTRVIGCNYGRVQFTPDLLPADITGGKIWRPQDGRFELIKGPIFTNVLLADEINRTPPKTQAALLEAMEERQVTIEGETLALEMPFFVLATQNPIEQEGTYPLPEAQLDRFVVKLSMGYPSTVEQETTILKRRVNWRKDDPSVDVAPVITQTEFLALQAMAENAIYIDDSILEYVSKIVRATREHKRIEIGSSPRGALSLLKLSRCLAVIYGRDFVIPDDIKALAVPVLAHRLFLTTEARLRGKTDEAVIAEIIEETVVPIA